MATKQTHLSLLVSQPDAMPGYQTDQMLYINKLYSVNNFVHNAWISSPGNMLYPLMIQSLQHSHYFNAIVSGPDSDTTDYRIDTQLIEFQQNFLSKPSVLEFSAKVVLTHVKDNRVVSSQLLTQRVNCPEDTPYGGVIAANQAAYQFTAQVATFVIKHVKRDLHHPVS